MENPTHRPLVVSRPILAADDPLPSSSLADAIPASALIAGVPYDPDAQRKSDSVKIKLAGAVAVLFVLVVLFVAYHPKSGPTTSGKLGPSAVPSATTPDTTSIKPSDVPAATPSATDNAMEQVFGITPDLGLFSSVTARFFGVIYGILFMISAIRLIISLCTFALAGYSSKRRAAAAHNMFGSLAMMGVILALPIIFRFVFSLMDAV